MEQCVTIIIPVFNCQTYVEASVRSALAQTYPNIEVIAVNDGSKDASLDILEGISQTDSRLTVIDQPNGGVTAARLTGIANSTSQWICFLDADDVLPSNAISQYSTFFETDADIIISGYDGILDKEKYMSGLLRLKIRPELWGKCFKTSLIKEHMPHLDRSIVMGEDLLQNLVLGTHSESLATVSELLYDINTNNPCSVTKTFKHTEQYENAFFGLLDNLLHENCSSLPNYGIIEESAFWSKLNGFKQIVLDGNCFNIDNPYWKSIKEFYNSNNPISITLGPSEKLFLKFSNYQTLYRLIMSLYLKLRH